MWTAPHAPAGWLPLAGEHCLWLGEDLPLAWVPADMAVAVVLELVLLPASAAAELEGPPGALCEAAVLAWGAAVPFSHVAGGGEAAVAEGPMQASCGGCDLPWSGRAHGGLH